MANTVEVAAILRAEDRFLDEWLAYHRLLGVDRFLLYDDDPRQNLRSTLRKHEAYVTVFNWYDGYHLGAGRNRQTRAYEHAIKQTQARWLGFIDGDEFFVLRKHANLPEFLANFRDAQAVALTWHMFGHNGYFANPEGLITESLTRRQLLPGRMTKVLVRPECVIEVQNAHMCKMTNDYAVFDANHNLYTNHYYPGKTEAAHINHYMCRSFQNWMARVERGEVAFLPDRYPKDAAFRYDERLCLKKFVEITKTVNEFVDEYMLQYSEPIKAYLKTLGNQSTIPSDVAGS